MNAARVHTPSVFDPAQYEIEDYLDNQRPQYAGGPVESYAAEIQCWQADMERVLGSDWQAKAHRCIHCGNTNVRWITAVRYLPTGEMVVFGADCTARLQFRNRNEFKLAQLKRRGDVRAAALKVWHQVERFLEQNPEIAAARTQIDGPVHAGNAFVQDVLAKLAKYGSLSEKQVAAVKASLARDIERATRREADAQEVRGDAPEGRVEITGEVVALKTQATDFGDTTKALVKLANNAKVWLTACSGFERGAVVTVRATFKRSATDRSFAFGSRPQLVRIEGGAR